MTQERSGRRGPRLRLRRPDGAPGEEVTRLPAMSVVRPPVAPDLARTVLVVAGLDPSGGAGIAADLKTIAAYRNHGASVVASATAQNTVGVQAIYDLPMEFVGRQIESVVTDIDIHAVKIGMLGTARTASIVASLLDSHSLPWVVLDPVLRSSTGTPLMEKKGIATLRDKLVPQVDVITPNMEEAAVLAGLDVTDLESMKEAARRIHDFGARHVVVTGGDMVNRAIDVLFDGDRFMLFDSMKIPSSSTHGAGCTFSTAIACQLARGSGVAEAVDGAKRYVGRAIRTASRIGKGSGPINHLVSPF